MIVQTAAHEVYIRRCFDLALRAGKKTKNNPLVGAVIVYKDRVIGEGYHEFYGGAHAEVNAINSVSDEDQKYLQHSTIYISLEPCNHFGKTSACTELILQKKIPRVIVSTIDPNPLMDGKSLAYLSSKGIEITRGILENEGKDLLRSFIINEKFERPYIILKFAQSKDGFLGKPGQQIWLSNKISKMLVHKLRSEVDGIMVGTETVLIDNPELTTRLFPGESPIRITVDRNHRIPGNYNIKDDQQLTYIFNESKNYTENTNHYVQCNFNDHALAWSLSYLFEKGICKLMVEGGAKLLNSFIKNDLWDEARINTCPQFLKDGIKAPIVSGFLKDEFWLEVDHHQRIYNRNSHIC